MATTTNFGWETPDDTDLVKDGAAAMRTLGNSIDTSFVDLKGGTTGQVLAKASATDLDFSWVAQDDSNAIQNAIVDAKGDLIAATANDTPARLAVGTNGQVLTADSTAATGLAWATVSSGSMTSIASGSFSGSTLTLSSISGSYKNLKLIVRDVYASSASRLNMRFNNDTASNYMSTGTQVQTTGGSTSLIGLKDTIIYISNTSMAASDNNNVAVIDLFDYASSTSGKVGTCQMSFTSDSTGFVITNQAFGYIPTTAINRIDLFTNAGTFSGGTYILYGVN